MLDALAALLLFSVVVASTCGALVHSVHAIHEGQLATQAVDIAADLIESWQADSADPAAAAGEALRRAAALPPAPAALAGELIELATTLREAS